MHQVDHDAQGQVLPVPDLLQEVFGTTIIPERTLEVDSLMRRDQAIQRLIETYFSHCDLNSSNVQQNLLALKRFGVIDLFMGITAIDATLTFSKRVNSAFLVFDRHEYRYAHSELQDAGVGAGPGQNTHLEHTTKWTERYIVAQLLKNELYIHWVGREPHPEIFQPPNRFASQPILVRNNLDMLVYQAILGARGMRNPDVQVVSLEPDDSWENRRARQMEASEIAKARARRDSRPALMRLLLRFANPLDKVLERQRLTRSYDWDYYE